MKRVPRAIRGLVLMSASAWLFTACSSVQVDPAAQGKFDKEAVDPSSQDSPGPGSPDSPDPKSQEPKQGSPKGDGPTYYGAAKAVLESKCVPCHGAGKVAPFELGDYEHAFDLRKAIRHSVESGSMPPWPPAADCQSYHADRSLSDVEKTTLLAWIDAGAPKGKPSEFKAPAPKESEVEFNLTLEMPEAYTPRGIDDNRCFLLSVPGDKVQYQRAFQVEPGEPAMLHHLLVYKVPALAAAAFHAVDAADAGPGYYCPGGPGPGIHPNAVELIADWVPGQVEGALPPGVGIAYHPGDLLIMQHHYNTAYTGKKPDKSRYHFRFVDEVKYPAVASLFFNPAWLVPGAMLIPPGAKDVKQSYSLDVSGDLGGLAAKHIPGYKFGDPLQIRMGGPHLHDLGSSSSIRVLRKDGSKSCLVDVPKWDFDWQGFYHLKSKLVVYPGDRIELECRWNNTAENQRPLPDGTVPEPRFVSWGDQTRDEMCLMGLMVTAVE